MGDLGWATRLCLRHLSFGLIAAYVLVRSLRGSSATPQSLSAGALALNQTLGYWLARKWLRRPIESWLRVRGKTAPQIPEAEESLWILLLRVTPGVPLFVQNYLLGLAQVRFDRYLAISFPVQLAYAVAFVSLGHAFKDSNVWRGMLAVSGLATVAVAVLLVRRHLGQKLHPPVQ